jgi:NADH-quinone oxidoreductase subunit A
MTEWALLGGFLLVDAALVVLLMIVTHLLGEKHKERRTNVPYESGITPTGDARLRFTADFYLIGVFFVIFDVSAIFIFAWAVAIRDLGWSGYAAILIFVIETVAGLAYIWRVGALSWGARRLAAHKERHGS